MTYSQKFESSRKAWETRRRRMAAEAARVRIALVRRTDGQYFRGGWGYQVFWTPSAIEAQQLPVETAARVVRKLADRGISSEVITL
jgi:hypothetical protein